MQFVLYSGFGNLIHDYMSSIVESRLHVEYSLGSSSCAVNTESRLFPSAVCKCASITQVLSSSHFSFATESCFAFVSDRVTCFRFRSGDHLCMYDSADSNSVVAKVF